MQGLISTRSKGYTTAQQHCFPCLYHAFIIVHPEAFLGFDPKTIDCAFNVAAKRNGAF